MIFKESKFKRLTRLLSRSYNNSYKNYNNRNHVALWKALTLLFFAVTLLLIILNGVVSLVPLIATVISAAVLTKKTELLSSRRNNTLEISDGCIVLSFNLKYGRKKESASITAKFSDIESIEYLKESNEIAIMGRVVHENGVELDAMVIDNIFTQNPLPELEKIKHVQLVEKGNYAEKWDIA